MAEQPNDPPGKAKSRRAKIVKTDEGGYKGGAPKRKGRKPLAFSWFPEMRRRKESE